MEIMDRPSTVHVIGILVCSLPLSNASDWLYFRVNFSSHGKIVPSSFAKCWLTEGLFFSWCWHRRSRRKDPQESFAPLLPQVKRLQPVSSSVAHIAKIGRWAVGAQHRRELPTLRAQMLTSWERNNHSVKWLSTIVSNHKMTCGIPGSWKSVFFY